VARHAGLTMVANLITSERRPRPAGLTLVPDEGGDLYAADLREHAQGVVDPDLVAVFEAGTALVQGAPMVAEAVSAIRTAPVRPPPTGTHGCSPASKNNNSPRHAGHAPSPGDGACSLRKVYGPDQFHMSVIGSRLAASPRAGRPYISSMVRKTR
jgi:hypothetical protein